eukprot:1137154-Pelagomonas_calceolata.AAC.1
MALGHKPNGKEKNKPPKKGIVREAAGKRKQACRTMGVLASGPCVVGLPRQDGAQGQQNKACHCNSFCAVKLAFFQRVLIIHVAPRLGVNSCGHKMSES